MIYNLDLTYEKLKASVHRHRSLESTKLMRMETFYNIVATRFGQKMTTAVVQHCSPHEHEPAPISVVGVSD